MKRFCAWCAAEFEPARDRAKTETCCLSHGQKLSTYRRQQNLEASMAEAKAQEVDPWAAVAFPSFTMKPTVGKVSRIATHVPAVSSASWAVS